MTAPRKSRFTESLMKARSKGETSSPSVISLYGVHRVTVEPSDEMKEMFQKTYTTLEEINTTLQKLAGANKPTSQIVQEALLEPVCKPETAEEIDEPAELSGVNEEALGEFEEEKYGHIVYAKDVQDDWNHVNKYPLLRWKEENGNPVIKYRSGVVTKYKSGSVSTHLTWKKIEWLQALSQKKRSEWVNEKYHTSNHRTGIRTFLRCLDEGLISVPKIPENELEKNMKAFREEEDPDSVFKPMLNAYSTRPDPNCGKIEGSLEVI